MKKTSIGFERVVQKVGFETVFHDAEVLRVELRRTGTKPTLEVVILTGRSLRESEIDQSSHRYYIVRLLFRGIEDVELEEFNHQNVIQSLGANPSGRPLEGPLRRYIRTGSVFYLRRRRSPLDRAKSNEVEPNPRAPNHVRVGSARFTAAGRS